MTLKANSITVQSLDTARNLNDWTYKIPGLITWGFVIFSLVGIRAYPYLVLNVGRVLALYMLLRIIIIFYSYVIGLLLIRRAQRHYQKSLLHPSPDENSGEMANIHHVVIIPNFKEPIEILESTLKGLAAQADSKHRLSIVLAMEESEQDSHAKAQLLIRAHQDQFAHIFATYHPANLPGDVVGKGSNEAWAARQAKRELVDKLGLPIDRMTITSCDSDSIFHPGYFAEITRRFATDPRRHLTIWQAPLLFDTNIWHLTSTIRLMTFFSNAVQISELANPWSLAMPLSTYTISLKLVDEIGYWDPAVISEDWHMYLRCFFATRGRIGLKPIFLPTRGDAITGENFWRAMVNFYNQALRHAWGGQDIGYFFQQWRPSRQMPFIKTLARLLKMLQDHLLFSAASIVVIISTLLSVLLENQYVLTLPLHTAIPVFWQVLNITGAFATWGLWVGERLRCSYLKGGWRAHMVLTEVVSWAMVPILTFVMTGIPVFHAQTKMLLGSPLLYVRAPKRVDPVE